MSDLQLLALLRQGVDAWNLWRQDHIDVQVDFNGVDLSGSDLHQADLSDVELSQANLSRADLTEALLFGADLSGADLSHAVLDHANLSRSNLDQANLSEARLHAADLSEANLRRTLFSGADVSGANLMDAFLIETNFEQANLSGCFTYGLLAWNVDVEGAEQSSIIVTHPDDPTVSVSSFELAQFISFLFNNKKVNTYIEYLSLKAILVLGNFLAEREIIADTIQDLLLTHGYMPIQCGLDKYNLQDYRTRERLLDIITALAPMCHCLIVDLTGASDFLDDLSDAIPYLLTPVYPFQDTSEPLLTLSPPAESAHLVFQSQSYADADTLRTLVRQEIIAPLERGKEAQS